VESLLPLRQAVERQAAKRDPQEAPPSAP
jgi:hypothetical protein